MNTFTAHILYKINTNPISYPIDTLWRWRSIPMLSHIPCGQVQVPHPPSHAYISLESILTLSLTQLMPIGDGEQLLCLVTSHADKHKCPIHTYMHTPCTTFRIYKILSLFILNKNTGILQQKSIPTGWSRTG